MGIPSVTRPCPFQCPSPAKCTPRQRLNATPKAIDVSSSKKYWHFIRCGDAALTLEVALNIRANLCIVKEEVFRQNKSLVVLWNTG